MLKEDYNFMTPEELAKFILAAPIDVTYSFATVYHNAVSGKDEFEGTPESIYAFHPGEESWLTKPELLECWYGIKKISPFDGAIANQEVVLIGQWGGGDEVLIQTHMEDVALRISEYFTDYISDDYVCVQLKATIDPRETIDVRWSIEDVQGVRPELSDEQAIQVLLKAKRMHDPSVGINWDVLRVHANMLYPQPMPWPQ